jgi:hypothetical protein
MKGRDSTNLGLLQFVLQFVKHCCANQKVYVLGHFVYSTEIVELLLS